MLPPGRSEAYFEDGLDMGNLDVICALAKKYVNDIWPLRERVLKGDYAADVKRDTDEIGDTKYDCQSAGCSPPTFTSVLPPGRSG